MKNEFGEGVSTLTDGWSNQVTNWKELAGDLGEQLRISNAKNDRLTDDLIHWKTLCAYGGGIILAMTCLGLIATAAYFSVRAERDECRGELKKCDKKASDCIVESRITTGLMKREAEPEPEPVRDRNDRPACPALRAPRPKLFPAFP